MTNMEHVSCSRCGKRVSQYVTVQGEPAPLIVRAFVECPECIGVDLETFEDLQERYPDITPDQMKLIKESAYIKIRKAMAERGHTEFLNCTDEELEQKIKEAYSE